MREAAVVWLASIYASCMVGFGIGIWVGYWMAVKPEISDPNDLSYADAVRKARSH